MTDSQIDFVTGAPAAGSLDVRWIHGAPARRRSSDPPVQVHHYDEHTVILRQSKSVSYEAPFLYLLFGNDRALLLDTGATADPAKFPLRSTVDQLIASWLDRHPRQSLSSTLRAGGGDFKMITFQSRQPQGVVNAPRASRLAWLFHHRAINSPEHATAR